MKTSIFKLEILIFLMVFFSCSKDDESGSMDQQEYDTKISITDAPIDNTNVSGAIVTITDVKVDEVSVQGFNKTTIDLLQLQNGNKIVLGSLGLQAGVISDISLVLDYESDDTGSFPGSYIETVDGIKHQLEASVNDIKINDQVEILASATNEIIIDFDLRKTIINSGEMVDRFDFVTDNELSNGLRLVNQVEVGTISGTISDSETSSEMIVAYAYEVGTYTTAEAEGQGSSNITFANAVTSSVVNNLDASYQLNFLKEGDYELHFASFSDENGDGEFEFTGMLEVESMTGLNLSNLKVTSDLNLSVNVTIKGKL